MTKTEKRVLWLKEHEKEIYESETEVSNSKRGGHNAKYRDGMSTGGWGYWVWAFEKAGIKIDVMNYWAGPDPTPSTAINRGVADYILKNAPKELL
jgi:hypothetical protein